MISTANLNDLVGADVHGRDDAKIGTVGQVYVDADDRTPTWVTIRTGLFGTSESFAPLADATFEGGVVRVAYDKAFVKDAPRVDSDGALDVDEEESLYAYYGHGGQQHTRADTAAGTVGHDTSGPTTDTAMTRSEERLHVGTERIETGRVRLRKHIVTEQVTKTVPVSHEEVILVREPITDANVGAALSGPELSEEVHEVALTEDRVVVAKETVPVERVRLATDTVTEQRSVTETVSHEEIELIDSTETDATKRRTRS